MIHDWFDSIGFFLTSHTFCTMAPLRTLAALALTFGVAQGFAPAASAVTKQTTRYDLLSRLKRLKFHDFHLGAKVDSKLR
jgi:hypothetical protein